MCDCDEQVNFFKPGGADPTLKKNQDRINKCVWLTRLAGDDITGGNGYLFNAKLETGAGPLTSSGVLFTSGSWDLIRCRLDEIPFYVMSDFINEILNSEVRDLTGRKVVIYLTKST